MKRTSLIILFILSIGTVKAQLRVDSVGNVSVDKTLSASGAGTITANASTAFYVNNTSSTLNQKRTAKLQANHYAGSSKYTYNLYSNIGDYSVDSSTPGRVFGIYSLITHMVPEYIGSTAGARFSICGINGECGAAVYGGTSSYYPSLSQPYAGYFNGLVNVQGNLSVSGSINGTFLTPSLNMSSGSETTEITSSRGSLSAQLQGLTAKAFFYDRPQRKSTDTAQIRSEEETPMQEALETDADTGEDNTPEMVFIPEDEMPLNHLGQQVLSKQHYTLSAEELEEIFPDLVYENEDGTKSINYVEMVPILVQAIGELSAKVEALESGKDVKKAKKATGLNEKAESVQVMSLGQNKPNPFSTTTEVEVTVPESVQHAFVYVYDLNGKKVQQVDVTARGKQTVSINAATLEEGMYLYSLIADGQVVQTRRMIIEK